MTLGVRIGGTKKRGKARAAAPFAWLILMLGGASCVPVGTAEAPRTVSTEAPLAAMLTAPGDAPLATGSEAAIANAAIPVFEGLNPAAGSHIFAGRTPLDRLRALDCLAQAIYYEAASESEDGQRAVAQVVLNRVRHPAWPNSVCGVVYQGPMRPGGGCQFTFTCDGSLTRRAGGIAWARARALAAEALAGRTYAPIGLSTHYHTHEVLPGWAHRLHKTGVIGAHNFYRLTGDWGAPAAFAASYSGSEPFPRPSMALVRSRADTPTQTPAFVPAAAASAAPAAVPLPSDIPQDPRWTANEMPQSTVREEYRQSGQWRDDAPAAVTGRR